MGLEIGWQVAVAAATWLQQAIKAARNRREQRFAHIVENAGILVAGLRSIDRELHRLFLPLLYLNPKEWPEGKRREWAERILALANEDIILPRMRIADSALTTLITQENDPHVAEIIESLQSMEPLNHRPIGTQDSVGQLLTVIAGSDDLTASYMPIIAKALLGQEPLMYERLAYIARSMVERLIPTLSGSSI